MFRTDGIVDFLISYILINAIKRNEPKSTIIVIASKKNYTYVKSFSYIDEIILFPDKCFPSPAMKPWIWPLEKQKIYDKTKLCSLPGE